MWHGNGSNDRLGEIIVSATTGDAATDSVAAKCGDGVLVGVEIGGV